ncbi:MAG: hypothetical protein ACRCZF_07440, partial [Gemmataceae bacterium]
MMLFHSRTWLARSRSVRLLRSEADFEQLAGPDWPTQIMDLELTDRFHAKQGRSIARWQLSGPSGSLSVYVKRHYELPLADAIKAYLFPGRA